MRVVGAAIALAVFRIAALAGHDLSWSWWSPIAYAWHDAAVLLLYFAIDRAVRRAPRTAWTIYAAFVAYVALGIPVARVMSTPMTWTMWRAAGGALGDSIWQYVTIVNVFWVAIACVGAGIAVAASPAEAGHYRRIGTGLLPLTVIAALGPAAVKHVDTRGLDRNPWSALAISGLPRVSAGPSMIDLPAGGFARSPIGERSDESSRSTDLLGFRGIAARRNVMLVSLESTAAQYLGLYGAEPDVMPNLTELAASAIVFDNAYAVHPESIKGLLSILCSVYPAFDRPAERYATSAGRSLASALSDHGYRTALFHSGRFDYLGMNAVVRNRGFQTLADAGDIGGRRESSFGVDDNDTVNRILEWIDRAPRSEPFFVTYLPIAGHHPYDAPGGGPFSDPDEFGRYRNALHYGDDVLGRLMRELKARGLEDDTMWIVLGDHGEAFGQHDGNFGHTFQLYEENVHVPFIAALPGALASAIRRRKVVSLIDTAPTVLDLLGLPADPGHQGHTMLDGEPRMALFFADYSLGLLGLRDGSSKYIYEIESRRSRLFDLDHDPLEAHDVAAARADLAERYSRQVRAWSKTQLSSVSCVKRCKFDAIVE